jgi:hypothetical protein
LKLAVLEQQRSADRDNDRALKDASKQFFESVKSLKNSKTSLQKAAILAIEGYNIEIAEQTQKLDQIKTCKRDTVKLYKDLCNDQISGLISCQREPSYEFRRSPLYCDPPKNAQNVVFPEKPNFDNPLDAVWGTGANGNSSDL